MLLVEADISSDPEIAGQESSDPYENLANLELLENRSNNVDRTTAVSIVFLTIGKTVREL